MHCFYEILKRQNKNKTKQKKKKEKRKQKKINKPISKNRYQTNMTSMAKTQ